MFNKHFSQLYEKVYIISYLTTLVSLFLPWLAVYTENVLGIRILFGIAIFWLLFISALLFFRAKIKEKVLAISSIVIGILCLAAAIGTFIGYRIPVSLGLGFIQFGIGPYIATVGSIGSIISGVLGLKHKRKQNT